MNKKIAIPTTNGVLSAHFGHCEKFAIYDVENSKIVKEEFVTPPPHEPGSHPAFLRQLGCDTIIAGGMGNRAQSLFIQNNIEVILGLRSENRRSSVETCFGQGRRRYGNDAPVDQPAPQYSAEAESDILKTGISSLKAELKAMEERLSQLLKKDK